MSSANTTGLLHFGGLTTRPLPLDTNQVTKRRTTNATSSGAVAGDIISATDFANAVRPKQAANAALEVSMATYGITVLGLDEQSAIDVAADVMDNHVKTAKVAMPVVADLLAAYREAAAGVLPL